MTGRPPGGGRQAFSDEDSRLDRLAISATSASNQAASSDTIAKKAAEEERSSSRHKIRMCIWAVCIIFALGALVTGAKIYGRYAERKQQERIAAEARAAREQEEARVEALTIDTRKKVAQRLARFDFDGAFRVVADGLEDGLASVVSAELEQSIRLAGQTRRSELIALAGAKLDEGHMEEARELIPQIGALCAYSGDRTKLEELYERMRVMAREKELEPGRVLIRQSREALADEDWNEALRVFELVSREVYEPSEVRELEGLLKKTIGGRLIVDLAPSDATFKIGDSEPHSNAELVVGLANGKVEFAIERAGHVPMQAYAYVQYPRVTRVNFTLEPEVPEPLWALRTLQGTCAQALAREYYAHTHKDERWLGSLSSFVQDCRVDVPSTEDDNRRMTRRRREALLDGAVEAFLSQVKKDPLQAMDELEAFRVRYPDFARTAFRRCVKQIGEIVDPLGRACCDCRGHGSLPCPGCDGTGECKEDRVCPDCGGSGEKVHKDCHGTGQLTCPRCDGTGKTEKQVIEDGRPVVREVSCSKCNGTGKIHCEACRGTGKVTCVRCRGAGRARILGPCSECGGKGRIPCESCRASGSRDEMDIERRRQVEEELRRLLVE